MVPIDQLKTVNQWLKREDIQEVELYPLMVGTILVPDPFNFLLQELAMHISL